MLLNDLRNFIRTVFDFYTVIFYGLTVPKQVSSKKSPKKETVWKPTQVQFLYRHKNGRYYVRTFASGKEKWTSLKTTLLSIAKNRMREHVDAAERQRLTGAAASEATGNLTFGQALKEYQERLKTADIRPNTKAFREAGVKLVLRSWPEVEEINVRRITSRSVESWLVELKASAKPHTPPRAKSPARNSTGASFTTLKCALDSLRQVLDVAVDSGHLYANPARNTAVTKTAKGLFKAARRERTERGTPRLPTREEFAALVESIRKAGVSDCRTAADYVQFIAFCGCRKKEAANVTWKDIDFGRGTVQLRVTKNGEARHVPMNPEMRDLLTRLKDASGSTSPDSSVLQVRDAQGFITSACRKLGIPRFTTHALRHLFGTACLEAGVDVRTVASWLGHKDHGALLLKIYSHVRSEHETEMAQKVRLSPPP